MSRRTDYSLILVTERVVVRFDTRTQKLMRSERRFESLAEEVRSVTEEAPARHVAVFSTEVWNQLVSISRAGVEGLENRELSEALKYEVEPLVGIDASMASLGFIEVDGTKDQRQFWVNVLEREQWLAVCQAVKSKKNREVTVSHPLAVSNLGGHGSIEFWDKTAFRLTTDGKLIGSDAVSSGSERWVSELGFDSLDAALAHKEILVGPDQEMPASEFAAAKSLIDLSDEASLVQWFKHAAQRMPETTLSAPMIRPEQKAKSPIGEWVLRAAALLLIVGFCGWHLSWLNHRAQVVDAQIESLGLPGIEKQKYDSMLQEVMQKREVAVTESVATKADLQRVRFFFENQTDRTLTLLNKLVELRTNDLVVREIAVNEKGTIVSGVSLDSDAAPLLTNRLRDSVSSVGWKIHPASQEGLLKMTSGGPWNFSILLEDVGPPGLRREGRSGIAAGINFPKRVGP